MKRIPIICLAFFGSLAICSLGCSRAASSSKSASPSRPPVQVDVAKAEEESIIDYREFTGRVAAINSVEVRARVSGYLLQSPISRLAKEIGQDKALGDGTSSNQSQVRAREGALVQNGTLLFKIDPEPYLRLLEQAEGNIAAKRAQRKRFDVELARTRELVQSNSVSKAELDSAVANADEAIGQIANLDASVAQAQLNVDFTQVTSPIDGLLGQTMVTDGNLVVADATILTTVISTDRVYAYFDVDENSVLDYRSRARAGTVQSARGSSIPIDLGLANETDFPHPGFIDFVNNTTDPGTGNTRLRGVFENKSGTLSPGLFCRIRAPFSERYTAILIPTIALATDQAGKYVMSVDSENVVHRRSVRVASIRGLNIVVREGLETGDIVVVTGIQKIKEGDKVDPKPRSKP